MNANISYAAVFKLLVYLIVVAACLFGVTARAEPFTRQVALIIGNSSYRIGGLSNPVNDAHLMQNSLEVLGFDVQLLENATRQQMLDNIYRWLSQSRTADTRLVYFAGHGVQLKGKNYLIPVDAEITTEDEIPAKAINVTELIDRISRISHGVNVFILDACRNTPFMSSRLEGRGASLPNLASGLAEANAPMGTFIAYSTSPGSVAADGVDDNSAYTRSLAAEIQGGGVPIEAVFKRVRISVMRETHGQQIPWESSSLVGDFCFKSNVKGGCGLNERETPANTSSVNLNKL